MNEDPMDGAGSLCIGICQVDEESSRCIGCGRLVFDPNEPPPPAAEPEAESAAGDQSASTTGFASSSAA